MKYTSLDKIVKGYLLQRRYPIHWYVDFLVYAQSCFAELHFDSIGNVRSVKLTIGETGAVTLPTDYVDWCKVGVLNGQFIKPLIQRSGIARLANTAPLTPGVFDTTFDDSFDSSATTQPALYPDPNSLFGFLCSGINGVWYNDHSEYTGRHYGANIDRFDTFKVLRERNEIQIHQGLSDENIILEYISDGSEIDNATQITPYAKATFEAYINWKLKENGRSYSEGERMRAQKQFDHQHRILRARMDPFTLADLRAIIYRNSSGAPK